jgi:hypothetical protein
MAPVSDAAGEGPPVAVLRAFLRGMAHGDAALCGRHMEAAGRIRVDDAVYEGADAIARFLSERAENAGGEAAVFPLPGLSWSLERGRWQLACYGFTVSSASRLTSLCSIHVSLVRYAGAWLIRELWLTAWNNQRAPVAGAAMSRIESGRFIGQPVSALNPGAAAQYEEVEAVICDFGHFLDLGDPDRESSRFLADGVLRVGGVSYRGYAAIGEGLGRWLPRPAGTLTQHWVFPELIEPDGDGYAASSRVVVLQAAKGSAPRVLMTACCRDRLVSRAGTWKISEKDIEAGPLPGPPAEAGDCTPNLLIRDFRGDEGLADDVSFPRNRI